MPPGSDRRRDYEVRRRRERRIMQVTDRIYATLLRIPPRWSTMDDEYFGKMGWKGLGPVVAQFWHDYLDQWISAYIRKEQDFKWGDALYSVLDGLAWRFFDDEYVPTLTDVATERLHRRAWRAEREDIIKEAEQRAKAVREWIDPITPAV